jgi:alpha-amylase
MLSIPAGQTPARRFRRRALAAALAIQELLFAGGKVQYPVDTTTIEPGHQLPGAQGWYRDAAIYHIWVKAFADGIHDDGIGDLPGIRAKLGYLQDLGVDTLWLSPIFECAYKGANMHGYDTTDYFRINDRFGTQRDLQELIDDIHARKMRVIFDFVPNHTSTSHPWFQGEATRKTWYVWKDKVPSGWGRPWGGGDSDDVWKELDGAYFYSAFSTSSMADLDYANPEVRKAMLEVERHWLDRGFDGLRMDAARYLCETGPGRAADQPATHALIREFRKVANAYPASPKVMIAEAWTPGPAGIAPYFGDGTDEFQLCLDFSAPEAIFRAIDGGDALEVTRLWDYERDHYPAGARMAAFDSNHDNLISRPGTQYAGNKAKIVLAEALVLLGPGTPVLYYGNEVGMAGKAGSDLDLRQPMDWAAVEAQKGQEDSILTWCRCLLRARKAYPAFRGAYRALATEPGPARALAFLREADGEKIVVVANLTNAKETVIVKGLDGATGASAGVLLGPGPARVEGGRLTAPDLPPYGVRAYYAAGGAFKGTLHGDLR